MTYPDHPLDCRCRECIADEVDPADRHGLPWPVDPEVAAMVAQLYEREEPDAADHR